LTNKAECCKVIEAATKEHLDDKEEHHETVCGDDKRGTSDLKKRTGS
jgi:hypothetical protein